MITVQLRWIVSSNSEFPFQWTLPEDTTIEKLCKMVIDKNNLWYGNPTFSVVKIYGDDMFLNDSLCLRDIKNPLSLIFAAG
jgi:hypothetical protein